MKIIKKIAVVLMALVMTVALFAFAACDPADGSSVVDSVLAALQTQNYAAVTTEMSGTVKQSGAEAGTLKANGKLNLASGGADVVTEAVGTGEAQGEDNYSYIYMRGWNAYTYSAETKPSDLNSIEWSAEGNLNDMITEALQGEGIPVDFASIGGLASVCRMVLPLACHLELSFAKAAGGITEDADAKTLTVDVNKVLYNFVNDIKGVINGITESTTVGDVLNNQTVKKYFGIITELIPVDTVKNVVVQSGINVQPDEGSSTYDYLVKIISSEELKAIIFGLPQTLDKCTVSSLLEGTGIDISTLKTAVGLMTSGITETQFAISVGESAFVLKNAKEVYAYDDNFAVTSISSQITLSLNYNGSGVEIPDTGDDDSSDIGSSDSVTDIATFITSAEITLSGTTNLLTSEVTLEEIDFSNVTVPSV